MILAGKGDWMFLGIDLGGAKIAYALSDETLNISSEKKIATASNKDEIFQQLVTIIAEYQDQIQSVGIGTPGMINNQGKVINAPNLPGWNDFDFRNKLNKEFPTLSIYIENDANCAAIAENITNTDHKYSNFVYITISTGIGGGIIINNNIYRGAFGIAGEIGHMILLNDGPVCGCGQKGCWEALASGTAMARDAANIPEIQSIANGKKINTELLVDLANNGNIKALNIFKDAATYHAQAINNLKVLFDPEAFIIGGGVTKSGDLFWDTLSTKLADYHIDLPILKASNNSGTVGALALAIKGNNL